MTRCHVLPSCDGPWCHVLQQQWPYTTGGWHHPVNSLDTEGCGCIVKSTISKGTLLIEPFSCEIPLVRLIQDFTDDQSTLVQVRAWCHQAPSLYQIQSWLDSMVPYGINRDEWVNSFLFIAYIFTWTNAGPKDYLSLKIWVMTGTLSLQNKGFNVFFTICCLHCSGVTSLTTFPP